MATIEHDPADAVDPEVFDWRFDQLRRCGYPATEAWILAGSRDVDLRLAARLLDEGCPPETAARILA